MDRLRALQAVADTQAIPPKAPQERTASDNIEASAGANGRQQDQETRTFARNLEQFAAAFDELAKDLFQGVKLREMVDQFSSANGAFLGAHGRRFAAAPGSKFPDEDYYGQLRVDCQLVRGANLDTGANQATSPENSRLLAQFYRRACQASYLANTFLVNQAKRTKAKGPSLAEDDRLRAVLWGRYAIRHKADDFEALYWFLIAVGWQLNGIRNPKERTLLSGLFKATAERCIALRPADPLAYHLLGRYLYYVASLNRLERLVARKIEQTSSVAGGAADQQTFEATFEEAERAFQAAHRRGSPWLPTGLWMARVLLSQRRPLAQVKAWIDFGLALESPEPTTELEHDELLELRGRLGLAPANS